MVCVSFFRIHYVSEGLKLSVCGGVCVCMSFCVALSVFESAETLP